MVKQTELERGLGLGVGLSSLGTSVNCAESRWHELEASRLEAMAGRAASLELRGLQAAQEGRLASAAWSLSRARGMRDPMRPRLDRCATRALVIRCRCAVTPVWYRCGQNHSCDACRRRRARRQGTRIAAGLTRALDVSRDTWRRSGCNRDDRPRLYLWTLTMRHRPTVAQTADELEAAWRKFYKFANAKGWVFAYAATAEVTAGRDGLGHPHLHVVAVAPYLSYDELRAAWRRATGDDGAQFDAARKRRDGRASTPRSMANYIAKYIGKGVDLSRMAPKLAGETIAMLWGRRAVRTSRRFWVTWTRPPCPCCGVLQEREPMRDASRFRWEAPVALWVSKLRDVSRETP